MYNNSWYILFKKDPDELCSVGVCRNIVKIVSKICLQNHSMLAALARVPRINTNNYYWTSWYTCLYWTSWYTCLYWTSWYTCLYWTSWYTCLYWTSWYTCLYWTSWYTGHVTYYVTSVTSYLVI